MNWLLPHGALRANALGALSALLPVVLAAGAVVLLVTALVGSSELPAEARALGGPPAPADLVAPAPEELSSAAVHRDWEEVSTSPSAPKAARTATRDPRSPKDTKLTSFAKLLKGLKRSK